MTSKFQDEISTIACRMERQSREIKALLLADTLLRDVDLSDVAYHSVVQNADTYAVFITLNLDTEKKDSRLAHVLARKLGCKFLKSKSHWDKSTLDLKATIPAGDDTPEYNITICGSVPSTCKIIVKEIPLTDEEIEAKRAEALANVLTVRTEREIVCK